MTVRRWWSHVSGTFRSVCTEKKRREREKRGVVASFFLSLQWLSGDFLFLKCKKKEEREREKSRLIAG